MKTIDLIIILGIVFIIVGGALLFIYIKNDGGMCISNPLAYHQMKENISCWCNNMFSID